MEIIKMKRGDILGYVNSTDLIQPERYLEFDNKEDYRMFAFALECYNTISKCFIARLSQRFAHDLPEELGVDKGSDKLYFSVIVLDAVHYGVLVSDKDLMIPELLEKCLQYKSVVQLPVDERLKPLCLRMAYAKNIRVYNNPGNRGFYFSYDKIKSVYTKIKDAVKSGEKKISFHFDYVSEQTVRSYATRLKKETSVLSRVKVSGKITTLYFGSETELDLAEPDLRQLVYKYNRCITRREWEELFKDMMDECFEKSLPEPIEPPTTAEWQRLGYDSEQEWSDHMKEKEEAADDYWSLPIETTEPGISAYDADMAWNQEEDEKW